MVQNRSLLLITVANQFVGLGHYKRCHNLAKKAFENNFNISILISSNIDYLKTNENYVYYFFNKEIHEAIKNFSEINPRIEFDAIISDLAIPEYLCKEGYLNSIFEKIKKISKIHFAIDASGAISIFKKLVKENMDFLIIPYVSEVKTHQLDQTQILAGSQYAIMSEEYSNLKKRNFSKNADKILITCGGSDPYNNSTKIINALNKIDMNLKIRIIIGPLFSKENIKKINEIKEHSRHQNQMIISPDSLLEHFLWSDITISASGLTKYEIAVTGTPAIIFSIDRNHYKINKLFTKFSGCIDIGIGINESILNRETLRLLNSNILRKDFSNKSQTLFDGKGCLRIVKTISKALK